MLFKNFVPSLSPFLSPDYAMKVLITYHLQMNTLLRENRLEDVVDKRCKDADVETVEAVLEIAARCTDAIPDDRPSMNQVVQLLEQEVMSPCPSDFYESQSDYC